MRALGVLLVAALLAGCSDPSSHKFDPSSGPSATGSMSGSGQPVQPIAPLPAVEVFNDTLTFPSASGGSAGSGSFDVPKGYANVTVTLVATGQCPGYVKGAGVAVTIGALDETIAVPPETFAEDSPAGYGAYGCAPFDYAQNGAHRSGTATMAWSVQAGTGALAAKGEFTGEALVVVVASA